VNIFECQKHGLGFGIGERLFTEFGTVQDNYKLPFFRDGKIRYKLG
jgi:hypothetical protein